MRTVLCHPYHLVEPSPWPLLGAGGALFITVGSVIYFHYGLSQIMYLGVLIIVIIMFVWWQDVIRESTFQGHHSLIVKQGIKYGMLLFILSEVLFFFSFFWAFFHSSLAPAVELGVAWPPQGVHPLDSFSVPLLNTAILLSSGGTVTWAHHAIVSGKREEAILGLSLTVLLGVLFTGLQAIEYYEAPFAISDSVYGSTFFMATGFHGFHVIIGTTFLTVCLIRLKFNQFTCRQHVGFEAASWYWHFVDVVWLFLYLCIYWWGS
uniref:Cytochrome c oxidase subunit 3 n=24 Tax=Porites TaxID=46719 RepID=A0A059V7R3_9CNID|nr:cytochrome c oxidase subunit III [Porites okinawensis]YP_009034317.1 cytochrome c oxidase subunit III [Porites panamensis]YP_009239119.1 cytochrome c oxidase subunit III [Porites lutea]YP_009253458.1 cytochrome c oxidase subunit III [Porites lobata]YP_009475735.1 cytochrome c oxidase subunit III [Porites fontanesii]YP_009475748.1 cytochrome c oxidase subunit III [Porites harrisoni]YP_654400.1 cytochrome c oxidase subunit III [Porites porites]AMZ79720.1 cytochrome c oxidase subunit III [Po